MAICLPLDMIRPADTTAQHSVNGVKKPDAGHPVKGRSRFLFYWRVPPKAVFSPLSSEKDTCPAVSWAFAP